MGSCFSSPKGLESNDSPHDIALQENPTQGGVPDVTASATMRASLITRESISEVELQLQILACRSHFDIFHEQLYNPETTTETMLETRVHAEKFKEDMEVNLGVLGAMEGPHRDVILLNIAVLCMLEDGLDRIDMLLSTRAHEGGKAKINS